MTNVRAKIVSFSALISLATMFQLGGCAVTDLVGSALNNLNPCGTIAVCDPRAYQFARSGIDGPGANPDIDPFCTFPPFCTQAQDPIFGGLGGG